MADKKRPLEGLRVVEMGAFIAGPFCGQLLADFGAEVIKIEPPGKGDPMRQWGRHRHNGKSLWWPVLARNKKSVTLNLKSEKGRQMAKELIDSADFLLENFRAGMLEKWGMDYETLKATNPGLIMIRVSGYGQTGPYKDKPGFGSIGEAMGGIRYITGYPDRPPTRIGISIGDSLTSVFGAIGGLVALHERSKTGKGQVVDISIYEAVLSLMESLIPEYQFAGEIRERTGSILPNVAPSNIYPSSTGSFFLIAANADNIFGRLCKAMERPELAEDPRYATHNARGERQEELDELIAQWTVKFTTDELQKMMDEHGVPAGLIYTPREMLADPHFKARNTIIEVADKAMGNIKMQNVFPYLSETPGGVAWTGPELGEHNRQVYGDILNIDAAQLEELQSGGVI
ncbi:CaiB/BaiF CoA transferase family protein [Desulforhopalus singaporensis]|uniref:Succinyl-CoA:(R)-citramalate CoA-transferase n=1 Tax=Desulforhopalus singaporensis TaxID=91360 RepID=A0A1H0LTK1_9BACT|nr:CaiB/BaiF CoA-transferase family protein [Desulforhopalus singaporensis]SDO71528.1 succinyl-CoA:(R)-citramalate CoA-transferase [Desulforhopalus singaporensis]